MDSLETNKILGAVLTAGITFMVAGVIGQAVVAPHRLAKPAIAIEGAEPAAAAPASGGGGGGSPSAAAAAAGPGEIEPLLASADVAAGGAYAKKVCGACHSFNEGGKAIVGPNLYGVVGGPHAHMPGYNYSDAIKAKTGPWTFDALNEWLYKPAAYAPGTKMAAFGGVANDKTRADVIAYLDSLSPNPVPLPKK